MDMTQLGQTEMPISRVGFGAWAIGGGGWVGGWGPQDDDDSVAAIHRALELGVTWIDTAAVYGIGHSEEVVGRAIKGLAEQPLIFTKCGLIGDPADGSVENVLEPDSIRREAEDSLRRLGVEAIDLYQIHWPDPDEDIEAAWSTLVELREAGKVRHIGVSNFDETQLERIAAIAPVETLQPHYSLVERAVEARELPWVEAHGTGVIAYSPMESGLLTGKMTRERIESLPDDDWRRTAPPFSDPLLEDNLALVERLNTVAARRDCTPGAVAIAWVLGHPTVTAAIVGARRPDQIEDTVVGGSLELSADDLRELGVPPRGHESYLPATV